MAFKVKKIKGSILVLEHICKVDDSKADVTPPIIR